MELNRDIRNLLLGRKTDCNMCGLIDLMEYTTIEFRNAPLINYAYGLSTINYVYLNIDSLKFESSKFIYYIILHEIGHYKRIVKLTTEYVLKMLSSDNIDELLTHIMLEEAIADRYASLIYYKLNGELLPSHFTHRLDDYNSKMFYESTAKFIHGKIKNNINNYNKLVDSFII